VFTDADARLEPATVGALVANFADDTVGAVAANEVHVVEHEGDGRLLATASTTLVPLGRDMRLIRLPARVREVLHPVADPVRLGLTAEE